MFDFCSFLHFYVSRFLLFYVSTFLFFYFSTKCFSSFSRFYNSTGPTTDFTVLRLHGDTGALISGSLATFLLLYIVYRGVLWKRSRMSGAREEAEDGPRAWACPGRVLRRAPPDFAEQEVCEVEEGPRAVWGGQLARGGLCGGLPQGSRTPQDVLQGHCISAPRQGGYINIHRHIY